ncbi:hypothetical protein EHW66_21275 [Erwinia psidii]|uniref:hypothetical protein n=1 Tax=Erwinia psidii TaxID=69224 RepID=UPI00226B9B58|nr:hypothetical protein [Erwinia psidii]MCX8967401.1 hypothetical protein [Erwinia psidii]
MKLSVIREDAIDESFCIMQAPVYVVSRHGGYKRCLSRSAAINNLAHYMVTKTFRRSGISTNEDCEPVFVNGVCAYKAGDHTEQYNLAHDRTSRRIRRILNKKRKYKEWERRHDALKKQYAELLSNKPF